MEVVALVLSAVALVAAILSALYTRAQAKATEEQAVAANKQLDLLRQQWHDQRKPRVHARYHRTDHSHEAITFTNTGPHDLAHVTIEVGRVGHLLVEALAGSRILDHIGPWPIGAGDSYVINRVRPDEGTVTFRLTCVSSEGEETWTVPVECHIDRVPPTPFVA